MEKKTTEQNTKQGMEKKDVLKQFRELLNLQSMGEQSQDFMEFFQYVAGMRLQLGMMVDELQDVKEQFSQMQEHQPKSVTENLTDKVLHFQEKITNLSEHLSAVKDHLVETAAQAVSVFKKKGKAEMCKALQKGISGVKPILTDYREQVINVMTDYEKTGIKLVRIMNKSEKKVMEKLQKNMDAVDKAFKKLERLFNRFNAGKETEEGECP